MNRHLRRAQARSVVPTADQGIVQRATTLLERGDMAAAIEPLRRAIQLAPAVAEYHGFLSQALFGLGQIERAEAEIRAALALRPADPEFLGFLGRVQMGAGQAVPAVESFRHAVRLQPGHWAEGELTAARAQVARALHNWHLPMLGDLVRNDSFDAALRAMVRPDDVVLDIGTGTGLLAMMAARCGARHVYACEMQPDLAELARVIVARNSLSDRVTIIPKASGALVLGTDMPERATLLVTETFDSLLIGEGALESIGDARARLLTPDARIIPAGGRIMGQLASIPGLRLLHPLRMLNQFDLSPLLDYALEKRFYPLPHAGEPWAALSEPACLLSIPFDRPATTQSSLAEFPVAEAGAVQALVLWLELDLAPGLTISAAPGGAIKHWNPVAFLFDSDRAARPGQTLAVRTRMHGMALDFTLLGG